MDIPAAFRLLGITGTNANSSSTNLASKSVEDDVKRAYKRMCLKVHPDKPSGSKEKFQIVNEAYEFLQKAISNQQQQGLGGGSSGSGSMSSTTGPGSNQQQQGPQFQSKGKSSYKAPSTTMPSKTGFSNTYSNSDFDTEGNIRNMFASMKAKGMFDFNYKGQGKSSKGKKGGSTNDEADEWDELSEDEEHGPFKGPPKGWKKGAHNVGKGGFQQPNNQQQVYSNNVNNLKTYHNWLQSEKEVDDRKNNKRDDTLKNYLTAPTLLDSVVVKKTVDQLFKLVLGENNSNTHSSDSTNNNINDDVNKSSLPEEFTNLLREFGIPLPGTNKSNTTTNQDNIPKAINLIQSISHNAHVQQIHLEVRRRLNALDSGYYKHLLETEVEVPLDRAMNVLSIVEKEVKKVETVLMKLTAVRQEIDRFGMMNMDGTTKKQEEQRRKMIEVVDRKEKFFKEKLLESVLKVQKREIEGIVDYYSDLYKEVQEGKLSMLNGILRRYEKGWDAAYSVRDQFIEGQSQQSKKKHDHQNTSKTGPSQSNTNQDYIEFLDNPDSIQRPGRINFNMSNYSASKDSNNANQPLYEHHLFDTSKHYLNEIKEYTWDKGFQTDDGYRWRFSNRGMFGTQSGSGKSKYQYIMNSDSDYNSSATSDDSEQQYNGTSNRRNLKKKRKYDKNLQKSTNLSDISSAASSIISGDDIDAGQSDKDSDSEFSKPLFAKDQVTSPDLDAGNGNAQEEKTLSSNSHSGTSDSEVINRKNQQQQNTIIDNKRKANLNGIKGKGKTGKGPRTNSVSPSRKSDADSNYSTKSDDIVRQIIAGRKKKSQVNLYSDAKESQQAGSTETESRGVRDTIEKKDNSDNLKESNVPAQKQSQSKQQLNPQKPKANSNVTQKEPINKTQDQKTANPIQQPQESQRLSQKSKSPKQTAAKPKPSAPKTATPRDGEPIQIEPPGPPTKRQKLDPNSNATVGAAAAQQTTEDTSDSEVIAAQDEDEDEDDPDNLRAYEDDEDREEDIQQKKDLSDSSNDTDSEDSSDNLQQDRSQSMSYASIQVDTSDSEVVADIQKQNVKRRKLRAQKEKEKRIKLNIKSKGMKKDINPKSQTVTEKLNTNANQNSKNAKDTSKLSKPETATSSSSEQTTKIQKNFHQKSPRNSNASNHQDSNQQESQGQSESVRLTNTKTDDDICIVKDYDSDASENSKESKTKGQAAKSSTKLSKKVNQSQASTVKENQQSQPNKSKNQNNLDSQEVVEINTSDSDTSDSEVILQTQEDHESGKNKIKKSVKMARNNGLLKKPLSRNNSGNDVNLKKTLSRNSSANLDDQIRSSQPDNEPSDPQKRESSGSSKSQSQQSQSQQAKSKQAQAGPPIQKLSLQQQYDRLTEMTNALQNILIQITSDGPNSRQSQQQSQSNQSSPASLSSQAQANQNAAVTKFLSTYLTKDRQTLYMKFDQCRLKEKRANAAAASSSSSSSKPYQSAPTVWGTYHNLTYSDYLKSLASSDRNLLVNYDKTLQRFKDFFMEPSQIRLTPVSIVRSLAEEELALLYRWIQGQTRKFREMGFKGASSSSQNSQSQRSSQSNNVTPQLQSSHSNAQKHQQQQFKPSQQKLQNSDPALQYIHNQLKQRSTRLNPSSNKAHADLMESDSKYKQGYKLTESLKTLDETDRNEQLCYLTKDNRENMRYYHIKSGRKGIQNIPEPQDLIELLKKENQQLKKRLEEGKGSEKQSSGKASNKATISSSTVNNSGTGKNSTKAAVAAKSPEIEGPNKAQSSQRLSQSQKSDITSPEKQENDTKGKS